MSPAAQAIQDGIDFGRALRALDSSLETSLDDYLRDRLDRPGDWQPMNLERNGVIQGGIIVVSGEKQFQAVVDWINSGVGKHPQGKRP